jgi:CheY-like chemotaxis protein
MNKTYATILVCDDEAHIRHVIGAKLRGSGFIVREARNGQEALAALEGPESCSPALVITDLQMPLVTGLELAQTLRKREDTRCVPVLMLTARGYILSDDQLAQTNIRHVISKPFGVRQLLERVARILTDTDPALVPPALLCPPTPGSIAA